MQAVQFYRLAALLAPGSKQAHANQAAACVQLQLWDEAAAAASQVGSASTPPCFIDRTHGFVFYLRSGGCNGVQALALDPGYHKARYRRAQAYAGTGKPNLAYNEMKVRDGIYEHHTSKAQKVA